MALGEPDESGLVPAVVMAGKDAGPAPLTTDMAVGLFRAWLEDHRGAADARFTCRVEGDRIVVEHREVSEYRAAGA